MLHEFNTKKTQNFKLKFCVFFVLTENLLLARQNNKNFIQYFTLHRDDAELKERACQARRKLSGGSMMKRSMLVTVIAGVLCAVHGNATDAGLYGKPRPAWVGEVPEEPQAIYFVGRARNAERMGRMTLQMAPTDAQKQFADWAADMADTIMKSFQEITAEATSGSRRLNITSITTSTSGERIVDEWVAQDGTQYILVAYDKVVCKNAVKKEIKKKEGSPTKRQTK